MLRDNKFCCNILVLFMLLQHCYSQHMLLSIFSAFKADNDKQHMLWQHVDSTCSRCWQLYATAYTLTTACVWEDSTFSAQLAWRAYLYVGVCQCISIQMYVSISFLLIFTITFKIISKFHIVLLLIVLFVVFYLVFINFYLYL